MSAEATELSMERVLQDVERISDAVDRALTEYNRDYIFGHEIVPFLQSDTSRRVPAKGVIRLALFSDCLRVVDMALRADGDAAMDELELENLEFLVFPATSFYRQLRQRYEPFHRLKGGTLNEFLAAVRSDDQPFGHACQATHWIGLDICHRVALDTGDTEARDIYEQMVIRLMDEIIALGGVSRAEALERDRLERFIELRKKMRESEQATMGAEDPRVRGFCTRYAPRVFTPTQYSNQIWDYDPYDVEWVHEEARAVFERLIEQVNGPIPSDHGRILLVLGESGSGKTHLMRAFRSHVHAHQLGYVGYLQISTHATDYADFVLCKLIDSLERPYDPLSFESSGLVRLSNALAENPSHVDPRALIDIREAVFEPQEALHQHVRALTDAVISSPGYHELDPSVVSALLYLQRDDPIIRPRVLAYLRCESMNEHDRRLIGDLAPHAHGREAPLRMLEQLGRIMWATENAALVLLLDQIEDIVHLDESKNRLHNVFSVVRHLIDQVPTAVVVISCLDDLYVSVKKHLTRSTLDRIEREPAPVRLTSRRRAEEIEAIVAKRLSHLYDSLDIRQHEDEPLFPLRANTLSAFANFRTRDVLDWCHRYHEMCITSGRLTELPSVGVGLGDPDKSRPPAALLEQHWADFTTQHALSPPDDDNVLVDLLAWAVAECARELEPGYRLETSREDDMLAVDAPGEDGEIEHLLLGMCNRGPQRDALVRQIDEVERRAGERRPVIVRCSEFTKSAKTKTARRVGELLRKGGRRVVVEDGEWRTMLALREFLAVNQGHTGLDDWRRASRPLSQLKALRDLLILDTRTVVREPPPRLPPDRRGGIVASAESLDATDSIDELGEPTPEPGTTTTKPENVVADLEAAPSETEAPKTSPGTSAEPDATTTTEPARPAFNQPLHLGQTMALASEPLPLVVGALTRHAAFLGSSGSGKTTLALNIVEQLLARRVPVVLIDRKGDLAGYANIAHQTDAAARALMRHVDVSLYTPGEPLGRPLAIPVVPAGLHEMSSHERTKVTRYAASALTAMMQYKDNAGDRARMVILSKAIELLARIAIDEEVTLGSLIDLIDNQDPALVASIGRLDTKHFGKLVDDLEVLRMGRGELMTSSGEQLDPERLLGRTASNGDAERTQLSIISTKFLGDTASVQFWIARLLIELGRYASKHPSSRLQAALLFDEADVYLPAQSKPPTKEPMQDLLKRARSAGISVLLATQSPGDLDYRSRDNIATWFLGKISETRAIGKMKPLLSECRTSIDKKLPNQRVGEFVMLQGGHVTPFRAARSSLDTEQLSEAQIRELARATRPRHTPTMI